MELSVGKVDIFYPEKSEERTIIYLLFDINPIDMFGGDGSKKCQELLSAHPNSFFLENIYPSAQAIGFLADKAFNNKEFEDVAYFEPFYLKDFIGLQLKSLPSS